MKDANKQPNNNPVQSRSIIRPLQLPFRKIPSFSFYFWQGLFHYKAAFAGDFTVWTQNRDHGDDLTRKLKGKVVLFFAEPQLWYKLNRAVAVGSKINLYYHVLRTDNSFQVYPTAAVSVRL